MNKKHCKGCHDDYYNGDNVATTGAKECWSIHEAKLVWRKEVSIDQRPPWDQKAKRFPGCYHRPRWVYLDPRIIK